MPIRAHSIFAASAFAAALIVAPAVPAGAQDEPSAFQKILGGLGLLVLPQENGPDYRERAPLVVPPSNALIAPRNPGEISVQNPDWPLDHDSTKRRAADIEAERRTDEEFYSGRPLSPSELNRPGRLTKQEAARRDAAARRPEAETGGAEYAAGRERYSPSQLGFRGWGAKKEETVVFSGEPERKYLTDPPPGLRTPSREAPYGVVSSTPKAPKRGGPFDRGVEAHDPVNPR
jgi:hypothetical protein